MHRFIAVALAVACCLGQGWGQTVPPPTSVPPFTLRRALDLAIVRAPATDIGLAGVSAAQAARVVAGLRPNPELSVQTENVAGTNRYSGFQSAETTAQVTVPLEMGGKRSARIAVAEAQIERALVEQSVTGADLVLLVTRAYGLAAAAERRAAIRERQVAIALDAQHAAQVRLDRGAGLPAGGAARPTAARQCRWRA